MHLDWLAGSKLWGKRTGRDLIGDPFYPFCGSRKGGGRGLRGKQVGKWPRATRLLTSWNWGTWGRMSCRRDACRLGDQTRTDGQIAARAGGSDSSLTAIKKGGREGEMGRHGFASEIGTFISILR